MQKERYKILTYNQIILSLNQQQSGRFQTEAVGQHIQESIEEIGRHMYQEIAADIRAEILDELIAKGEAVSVLFETFEDGIAVGHTPDFIEVRVPSPASLHATTRNVRLTERTADGNACLGQLLD